MDKIKNWLFEEPNQQQKQDKTINCYQYTLEKYSQLEEIGTEFKNNSIIICDIHDQNLRRSIDYLTGICFILNYKHIPLTKNIHIFLPEYIIYNSIS